MAGTGFQLDEGEAKAYFGRQGICYVKNHGLIRGDKKSRQPVLRAARTLAAIAALLTFANTGLTQQRDATVQLHIEGNRPFVDVEFPLDDGSQRTARFWIDTGGAGFILAESLARDIGISWDRSIRENDIDYGIATSEPDASIGGFGIDLTPELDSGRIVVQLDTANVLPAVAPGEAEGLLPGHVLQRYHLVLDYPAGTFTIALPGAIRPHGAALAMPVAGATGFPRTEIEIDGERLGFLLDTGASFTVVSEVLLNRWGNRHPDWPRFPGAEGREARALGGAVLETLSVAGGRWGESELAPFGVVSRPEGTFERYMSGMTAAPIIGALAGNVLKHYRVELDYADETLYLSQP